MSKDAQMKRGANQALFKYLPESWIDFSIRGRNRKQYIAKVIRWNSEKIDGINSKRLIRKVDEEVRAFENNPSTANSSIPAIVGFGAKLDVYNCDVLSPKASDVERGIVAQISPLTFYCSVCKKVHSFKTVEQYKAHSKCCGRELKQFRQIYFCDCGYATDVHPNRCPQHGFNNIVWNGGYKFICTVCKREIPMQTTCKVCGKPLRPKVALDPAQMFPYSLTLIDLFDEKLEHFIGNTDYGAFATVAHWLGKLNKKDFESVIKNGLVQNEDEYKAIYEEMLKQFSALGEAAERAAKIAADAQCGNETSKLIDELKTKLTISLDELRSMSENILEYNLVNSVISSSSLTDANKMACYLDTNSNPDSYEECAKKYGVVSAKVCDEIPFITCTYGYTRGKPECENGVQLHALKEEKNGRKNIYATRLNTEGVIFEFDRKRIINWLYDNGFIKKEDLPNMESEEDVKLWFINNVNMDSIHPFSEINISDSETTYYVYRLIHSLSHILIRSVAEISGLGKDSLSEYLFPGVPAVLIYCQNSQGFNLGALFNTFEAYFDRWLNKAFDMAQKCIFDPVCMERDKACTGCLFLNEVSCRHFNKDLDRSLLIGHADRKTKKVTKGFWEDL